VSAGTATDLGAEAGLFGDFGEGAEFSVIGIE
jgi:hypothetical protein